MDDIFEFGALVFDDAVMKQRLNAKFYHSIKNTIDNGSELEPETADAVAVAMKNWAIEKGATHYCHWFMPMTDFTSEKHDAFLSVGANGIPIINFSGKNLIKGEPDASSFPSGGLRATFEARGYTAWDCTSPAFVKEGSLYIPTAFCSYNGDALDKKTPLLRSMDALNMAAVRLCRLLKMNDVSKVIANVGAEQEYFLIDQRAYEKRKDLMLTGRTLIGRLPSKGQEMEDHYFGNLKMRIAAYMSDLDRELWRLGIPAKTKHNENAPAQHELAPLYSTVNIATDHNYLTMEIMKKVALKHGLVCLLHEKPFDGVNGSGKHNNWSLITDTGKNMLYPSKDPKNNVLFITALAAVVQAVDDNAELLRMSVAHTGNDLRLGSHEAPPGIISIFLGEGITSVIEELIFGGLRDLKGKKSLKLNAKALPELFVDNSDRNRTSPFAFTGNKFEFRMIGASASISTPNTVLNAIVADSLTNICDRFEKMEGGTTEEKLLEIAKSIFVDHKRIVFNGNNYSDEWLTEAEQRGLSNINNNVDAISVLTNKEKCDVLLRTNTYTEAELNARYTILTDEYIKTMNIEALTLLEMLRLEVKQYGLNYLRHLAATERDLSSLGKNINFIHKDIDVLTYRMSLLDACIDDLHNKVRDFNRVEKDVGIRARYMRDIIAPAMLACRNASDSLEEIIPSEYWQMPTYFDLFYRI